MVTLGVALILYELANRFDTITGGADGLQGVVMGPLLGLFSFDLGGRVGYAYSLFVLIVLFFVARRLVHSPFGYGLQAIRDNARRATAIGINPSARLAAVYTFAASYAAIAGALLAQTTGFASLDVLDFHRSADVLLVLVIGGVGWLCGGVIGAVVFKLLHDFLSTITPQYWQGLISIDTLVGVTRYRAGSIRFGTRELTALRPDQRAVAGIGWVPQERNIFKSLTVDENLTAVSRAGPWNAKRIYALFPRLEEVARVLTRIVREEGLAAIIVEQHAHKILRMTDDALILERGRVAHRSSSKALLGDSQTLDRLIGVGGEA